MTTASSCAWTSAVTAIRGTGHGSGHVTGVVLGSGEELDADLVVVGIGAAPNTTLAAASGITVDDGIVTDAGLRTSAPDVFAAGDVANAYHPVLGRRLRVEHWANAGTQGAAAGRALAGADIEYDEIPYFFTDQFDLGHGVLGLRHSRGRRRSGGARRSRPRASSSRSGCATATWSPA